MAVFWGALLAAHAAPAGRVSLSGHVPAVTHRLTANGDLPATNRLALAIGLPLHQETALDDLIRELYDPHSPNYHQFLSTAEFTARFGPTEAEYQAVIAFAETNGLTVVGTRGNRSILDVAGSAAAVNRALGITLHTWRHPVENRDFFAPDTEPSVPAGLSVSAIEGLSNYQLPRPLFHPAHRRAGEPLNGSGLDGFYQGNDFRNAYVPGSPLTGAGQKVGLLEFSGYYGIDITNYESTIGMTNRVPLSNVVVGSSPSKGNNEEVALDIEMAIALAPQLAEVIVYEESSVNPSSILSRMASDNLAKQMSSSWTWGGGPSSAVDTQLKQMIAQGQSFYQAAGDQDAYTGAAQLDNASQTNSPVDSTNLTSVGGTTLSMNGAGASWSSETVWNYAPYGGSYANEGSGGGISTYYTIPAWQAGVSMATNQGSTVWRNIPDVAMCGNDIYVAFGNGTNGGVAGTSCAAPLWAGFTALINQQAAAHSSTNTVGFLNPALYNIGTNAGYANCFNDITTGNNTGTGTAGLFAATTGYDLASGWGTPAGTNLINALAPAPGILVQPAGQTVRAGTNVSLTATVLGQPPLALQWRLAGTNLPGATSLPLTLGSVTTNSAGNYTLVITNAYGAVTSSVAALTVVFPPAITGQPAGLTVVSGSNATFSATVAGTTPLAYQWLKNSVILTNGTGIAGATTNMLTLTAVTTNSAGNYSLVVTNLYGSATSSVAGLVVGVLPSLTGSVTNRTLQCGSNNVTFTVTAAGTAPFAYQWSLDGTPLTAATNTSFSITNLLSPSHTLSVMATNIYGAATNTAVLTVQDTFPPVITLLGSNPIYLELGSTFTDPGATAYDTCVGSVGATVTDSVNTNSISTNTLTYTAGDGNGNTNSVTRTVIVRDTTPPAITWSFTNLVLGTVTNCGTLMPDATGTNYIIATDLSGPPVITQTPTNNAFLPLGTNTVILTATDTSGNQSFSTNTITVIDQTPPAIVSQPQSVTNLMGTTAGFSLAATACTPLAWQWYFGTNALAGATNTTLAVSNVTAALAGNYFATATSAGGATTGSVAVLTVVCPPAITVQPAGLTVLAGSNATFSATATGTAPLTYQWVQNGTNLSDGPGLSGSATSTLSLTGVTTNSAGNYNLIVANLYGTATSGIASLIVGVLPTLTGSVTNQTLQCGSNNVTFTVTATGSAPFGYEWDLDGTAVAGATNACFSVTNLLSPDHTLAVIVTNRYGAVTNTAFLTVVDTLPPVITLLGPNPSYVELGGTYIEPGATGYDTCVGSVSVSVAGSVDTDVLGTNTLIYTDDDGNGNTNSVTRTVIVRDTTPPTITESFTNLVLGTVTNCGVLMPEVTGTNYILATDLSGPPIITETPTNGAFLPLGTNTVILTATDTSGNQSFSTNTITVIDQTPPVIISQPQSLTTNAESAADFSAAATACTPLAWQWYFGTNALADATNDTLALDEVSGAQAGYYYVVATSAGGSVTSSVVTLTVNLLVATVTPASSANPDGYLGSLAFTAAIVPTNATGSVQFFTNGVAFDVETVVAGQAVSTNTTLLPRGTNLITMVYSGDANDLPATNELDQIVTNHPPAGRPVTYTYGAGTLFALALTNLAMNWTDSDGDTVALAAVSVSTNGITVTNSGGFLIYGNPANVNDQFVCTLTDGWGGTNYETVNLTVVFPLIASAVINPDTTLGLTLTGSAGYTYVLRSTASLQPADWQPVATNTLDSSGVWNFNAGTTTNAGQMFYQLQLVQ